MANIEIQVVADHSFTIKAGFHDAVDRAIRKACFDIEAKAKRNITDQDAVDTGALRASVYADVAGHNGYSKAEASAQARAAGVGKHARIRARARGVKAKAGTAHFVMLPEVKAGPSEGIVAVGAEYGDYVEMGTVHIHPRPFLGPAAEEVLPEFDKVVADMINKEIDTP